MKQIEKFLNNIQQESPETSRKCFEWFAKNSRSFVGTIGAMVVLGSTVREIYSQISPQLPPADSFENIEKHKTIISAIHHLVSINDPRRN